ncbi:MAG: PqqD family protein [Candidatus Aminicenantes bacterium]|nr:PqqD family protein [Candidatus Aminicenantes bacterium]
MSAPPELDEVFVRSSDVVARVIEGELVIVPLTGGVGDLEGELFSLNETGRAIWDRMDGRSLRRVIEDLGEEFDAPPETLAKDVLGLIGELLQRSIIVRQAG